MIVASHNLMNGYSLDTSHYRELRDTFGLHILCLQEDRPGPRGLPGDSIVADLGSSYTTLCASGAGPAPGLSIVYDRAALRCVDTHLEPLPQLERLSWLERRYIASGRPEQRYAQIALFEPVSGPRLSVVNFHLETAGTHRHRRAQVRHIADALRARSWHERVVACGDTNVFVARRRRQPAVLTDVLTAFGELGLRDAGTGPTHFFARQNEPPLTHQLVRFLGRLGIDSPQRYDVMCTDLAIRRHGQVLTPGSDHDLVWTAVELSLDRAAAGATDGLATDPANLD